MYGYVVSIEVIKTFTTTPSKDTREDERQTMRIYIIIAAGNNILAYTLIESSLIVPVVGSYVSMIDWISLTAPIVLTMNKRMSVIRVAVAIFLTPGFNLYCFAQQHPQVSMDASTSAAI